MVESCQLLQYNELNIWFWEGALFSRVVIMLEVTDILDIHQPVQLIDNSCIFVQIDRKLTICKNAEKAGILDLRKAIFIEWE